jgi:hypothetical protein
VLQAAGIGRFLGGVNHGYEAQPTFKLNIDFGSAVAGTWRRFIVASLADVLYSTIGFKIIVTDPNWSHAIQGSVNSDFETYMVACVRTESTTTNTPDLCVVRGPGDRIRAVKTSTGNYEIQIQNEAQFREYHLVIECYAVNGTHTITYENGATVGSTGTDQYNASVGNSINYFENVNIVGNTNSTSTTTGALKVAGGVGVAGGLNVGGNVNITSPTTTLNSNTFFQSNKTVLFQNTTPFAVSSTTKVNNLNADLLDGYDIDQFLIVGGTATTTADFAVGGYVGFNAYYDGVDTRWEAKNTQDGAFAFRNGGSGTGFQLFVQDGPVTAGGLVSWDTYVFRDGDIFSNNAKVWNDNNVGAAAASIIPSANLTYDLGSSTRLWRDVYSEQFASTLSSSYTKFTLYGTEASFGIGMVSAITFGPLNNWAMTFRFSNNSDRGFWWGDSSHTSAQGAMALTTDGNLYVANTFRVGYGETDTTDASNWADTVDIKGNVSITQVADDVGGSLILKRNSTQYSILENTGAAGPEYISISANNNAKFTKYKCDTNTTPITAGSLGHRFYINGTETLATYQNSNDIAKTKIYTDLTIQVDSATDALRINQTGSGNAFVVEDSTNPDATPFIIDAGGNVSIGTTVPVPSTKLYTTFNSSSIESNYGIYGLLTDSSAGGANAKVAVYGLALTSPSSSSTDHFARGVAGAFSHGSTATVAAAAGVGSYIQSVGGGTITDGYNFYCQNAGLGTGGANTITNLFGYYTSDLTSGLNDYGFYSGVSAGANKWGFYSAGTANNYFAGTVGIGGFTNQSKLYVYDQASDTTLSEYGTLSRIDATKASGIASSVGVAGWVVTSSGHASTGALVGVVGQGTHNFTGTIPSMAAFQTSITSQGPNGTITNAYGLRVPNPSLGAASGNNISNFYGVSVEAITNANTSYGVLSASAAAANRWNFYASGTANNYFAGSVGIGSTSDLDQFSLSVSGRVRFLNNVVIGGTTFIRQWTSSDTDIDSVLPGSTSGSIIEAADAAHFVIGIRGNDSNDGFYVIDKNNVLGGPYSQQLLAVSNAAFTYKGTNVVLAPALNSAYAQANLAYNQANSATTTAIAAANTVRVSANTGSTLSSVGLNFNNTSTITVSVGSGTSGNANVSFIGIPRFTSQINTSSGGASITGNVLIINTTVDDALRITQTGTGNAIVIEDSTNPDATPFVIDSTGTVVVGSPVAYAIGGTGGTPSVQLHSISTVFADSAVGVVKWRDRTTNPSTLGGFSMSRSGSSTIGTYTAVSAGDGIGEVRWNAANGTSFTDSSEIAGLVGEGTIGRYVPGEIQFRVASSTGTSAPSTAFAINSNTTTFSTGTVAFEDNTITRGMTKDMGTVYVDKGTQTTGTQTFDYTGGSLQRMQVGGALTIAFSNFPPSGNMGMLQMELVNGGSATVTWPTVNWIKSDGTFTTSISTYLTDVGRTLQSSGTDFFIFWTRNAGTTVYGKLL